jgi:hypothetical protein
LYRRHAEHVQGVEVIAVSSQDFLVSAHRVRELQTLLVRYALLKQGSNIQRAKVRHQIQGESILTGLRMLLFCSPGTFALQSRRRHRSWSLCLIR